MHSLPIASARLADLLPPGAATAAVTFEATDAERLADRFPGIMLPAELAGAVSSRRLHYAAGRYCARVALVRLGLCDGDDLMRDRQGVPVWPEGIRGCISHTGDLAWAAVIPAACALGLGIDVERVASVERARIDRLVCGPHERHVADEAGLSPAEFLTLAFSFKESIFKCLFPVVRTFFEYRDATLTAINPGAGTVEARLDRRLGAEFPAGTTLTGRFALTTTHVFTSVHVSQGHVRSGRDTEIEAGREAGLPSDGSWITNHSWT